MPALRDYPLLLLVVVVPVLCAMVELGYRYARRFGAEDKRYEQFAVTRDQSGVLLSLMLGFTLALALSRYDMRTQQIVEEANAIGTAELRASLLPEPERSDVRPLFKEYVQTRVELVNAGHDPDAIARVRAKSVKVQERLWERTTAAAERSPTPITALFVHSVNETIDADDRRIAGLENRIPRTVWIMLSVLALFSSLLIGLSMRKRSLAGMVVPTLMFAIVALLIADLDAPGKGLIRPNERAIVRLQQDAES